ncbi:MAG: pilus assembly protein TadG-related protein [Nocardioides sp.]
MVGVWTLLMATGLFLVLLGLVVDGGTAINDRLEAKRAAEQAARGAADELSASGVRSQNDTIAVAASAARAQYLLTEAGWTGTVTITGTTVRVRVSGPPTRTRFLAAVGVSSFPVTVHGTATAITGPDG